MPHKHIIKALPPAPKKSVPQAPKKVAKRRSSVPAKKFRPARLHDPPYRGPGYQFGYE